MCRIQTLTGNQATALGPQRLENLAATSYHALGIPATAVWKDELDRPHHIYHGETIRFA
mgnify:CR=1 FL=1